ncbi:MAG TPA: VOC family protein [Candidatus Polarisedimenticolia bacterium]|nr:VOC family protein [Candidatus Polarisedimenticolia bacterium]
MMSDGDELNTGTIGWHDLTVQDAALVRTFYERVVGWESRPENMGGYSDFSMMMPGTGEAVAGVCHARGVNADLPSQWLLYIRVRNLQESIARCLELGGGVIAGPRERAGGNCCVIRDPAGAVCALFQP